jgi:hypothetical protein
VRKAGCDEGEVRPVAVASAPSSRGATGHVRLRSRELLPRKISLVIVSSPVFSALALSPRIVLHHDDGNFTGDFPGLLVGVRPGHDDISPLAQARTLTHPITVQPYRVPVPVPTTTSVPALFATESLE